MWTCRLESLPLLAKLCSHTNSVVEQELYGFQASFLLVTTVCLWCAPVPTLSFSIKAPPTVIKCCVDASCTAEVGIVCESPQLCRLADGVEM